MRRLVVVTPAGREHYLTLLSRHVLASPAVDEWQLWDNCRNSADRACLERLATANPRVRVVRVPGSDGKRAAISRFYRTLDDPDALYLKLDDDVVWLDPDFFARFRARAERERGRAIWFSPLVVNNAICTWLLKYLSPLAIAAPVSCQSACPVGWRDARFAEALHRLFLKAHAEGALARFRISDHPIPFGRFSINAIGFFGDDRVRLGEAFCPAAADDEEWISAVLPLRTGRPGMVFGDLLAVHFSFRPQERHLRSTDLLQAYSRLQGCDGPPPRRLSLRRRFVEWRQPSKTYELGLAKPDAPSSAS